MTYLVVYDIGEDQIRGRVSKILENFGHRVQESVFECRLGEGAPDELVARLKKVLPGQDRGNIRIYRICADCLTASFGMGRIVPVLDRTTCIIV